MMRERIVPGLIRALTALLVAPRRQRWVLVLLPALVAVLAAVLSSASTSAATTGVGETRVGASSISVEPSVGPSEHIRAGQRLGNDVAGPGIVVATGVAAKSADKGIDIFRHVGPGELADLQKSGSSVRVPDPLKASGSPSLLSMLGSGDRC